MPSDRAVLDTLACTVGPAPWYWQTFPPVHAGNRRYVWVRHESKPGRENSVLLHADGNRDHIILAVAMYSRVFALPPNLVGIWFEEGRCVRVFALDQEALQPFYITEQTDSVTNYGGFCCCGQVLGEFYFSLDLEAGEHRIDLPTAFAGLDRLVVAGTYAMIQEGACAAAFEIRPGTQPGSRRIAVYPQKWFTKDNFDLGYQWITRMSREPESGRLIGDGIRLPGAFVTEEDGCHVERWIGSAV